MPRQVSDEEYAWLNQQANTVKFIESIYNDPQLKSEAQALIKKKYPNMQIPEHDLESRVTARLEADRAEREREREEQRARTQQQEFDALRANTQKKYGFTDEAMTKLEKMMVERNVGDYEVAAEWMASKEPKPTAGTHGDGFWHHDKAPGFGEIAKDPEGWARGEILKSLYSQQEQEKNQRF